MRHWFKDQHFRSLLKNSGYLAGSRIVAAIAGVATLALAGRGLGVATFGVLILIHSYVQAASGLTKFNSWQVVVRYGAPALEAGETETFRRATGFAVGLDLASGLASMAAAMLLLPLLAEWFGIPAAMLHYALLYCLLLPTMGAGAPSGVLRTLDRFDLLSWQGTVTPQLRAVMALLAWWRGWPLPAYLLVWFLSEFIGALVLWWLAWRELRRRGIRRSLHPHLSAVGLDQGWQFAISVNLNTSLNTAWGPLARLFVGALLTPTAGGLYRVASALADAAQKPTEFLSKAFYPEVARLDPASKAPWRLMVRATALSTAVGLLMCLIAIVLGRFLLREAFGAPFEGAYGVLVVLLGAPLLAMVSFPIPPMLYAIGRTNDPLLANLAGALTYVAAIFPLTAAYGLVGAGLAFLAGRAVMVAGMALALWREHRRLRGAAPTIA
ncbi:MAG: lipopolysaccharide biosynthesis protein [Sphingomicrobium sp.]